MCGRSVGADNQAGNGEGQFFDGPPLEKLAPSGGQLVIGVRRQFCRVRSTTPFGEAKGLANLDSDPKNKRGGHILECYNLRLQTFRRVAQLVRAPP